MTSPMPVPEPRPAPDGHPFGRWLSPALRMWLYVVGLLAFGVAAVYGIIEQDKIDAWLLLLAGLLGVGSNALAARNVRS